MTKRLRGYRISFSKEVRSRLFQKELEMDAVRKHLSSQDGSDSEGPEMYLEDLACISDESSDERQGSVRGWKPLWQQWMTMRRRRFWYAYKW